ncbi:MAG TPA: SGNH/GDSL hydrolase family protein [Gemmatimonadaceae bacterium]
MISASPMPPAEVRILALGDSYTIGEGVVPDERWPMQLAAMLRARGRQVAAPTIVAHTGWTTGELSAGIDDTNLTGPYALVTLLIGVNNQYRGRGLGEYREQFRALLARAVGFAGGRTERVIVLSIPDWGVTPFAEGRDRARIARGIDAFNAVNREEAARAGTRYVDVTTISRRASGQPELVVADNLHPSAAMYALWVRGMLPAVLAAIS